MKNFWNIFLLTTATLALVLFLCIRHWAKSYIEPITYDSAVDKKNLKLCATGYIPQYYMISTGYTGGERALKNKLLPIIEKETLSFDNKNGNIAIRFIVNCHGEIGLFRAKGTDESIKASDFDKNKIDFLISAISELKDWQPGSINSEKRDSYYYINFKIENGQITDIF
ncbi:hypothetical protein [Maribacter sp. 2308TA10-17]|uniref:hypothetical protein n=1 Tax=Maribacter sp. 2308TA10-17 TaxID=3386276 RepID=UPI0039BD0CB4